MSSDRVKNQISLAFFMSRATPMKKWDENGLYKREIAIYQRLDNRLKHLMIFNSGGPDELAYQPDIGTAEILWNSRGLSPNLYSLSGIWQHRKALKTADLYKTNQLDGAWSAILAGKLYRKPVLVRAGYLWAESFERQNEPSLKARFIRWLAGWIYRQADGIVLTTEDMKAHVVKTYNIPADKITVIPNYVDTENFRPLPEIKKVPGLIVFVGRLRAVKNIDLLISAVAQIPGAKLRIIGEGDDLEQLSAQADRLGVDVDFMGIQPNDRLPELINEAELFVLPSKFEGHPKVLIEAMGCKMPVIGTDVEGINNVLVDGENGLLTQPEVESIRDSIQLLLGDEALRDRLSNAALQFTQEQYGLDKIVEKEIRIYQMLIDKYHGKRN